MGFKSFSSIGGLLFLLLGLTKAQEDSLRSALNAINRRQRDLSEYPSYEDGNLQEYGYSMDEGPDDLTFLSPSDYNTDPELDKNLALERALLNYLEDASRVDPDRNQDVKKRISSSFRERLEEDKERRLQELAENEDERQENENDDYTELIRDLWKKYRNNPRYSHQRGYYNREMRKRMFYPNFGYDSIGLRKRNKYYNNDSPYSYSNYNSRDYEDDDNINYDWNKNKPYRRDQQFDSRPRYNYPVKRFPVSKRSSNNYDLHNPEITHEHKRSTTKKDDAAKTDPKVAKDLSNIFGAGSTEKPTTAKPSKAKSTKKNPPKQKPTKTEKPNKPSNKEEVAEPINDKPLQIKKKSIDWSDYFGLDRRKKSDDELDNEWLMDRYHKAVALTTKRNAEYPLQSFKNHDQPSKKQSDGLNAIHKKENPTPEEVKISEMDEKLRNMEDTIIDDALKYTGAHEGTTDSQEIQEVKDRVISRLAAAYSLEKMRRALGEYKLSVTKERDRLRHQKNSEDYDISEEKRVSVPRKQAIDEEREKITEGDNNIKCAHGDEDCEEQNYRTRSEILEQLAYDECPKVQRACSEVATVLGHYARVFESACNMHQMCLLCSNNSWFAPTRQCNVLFLTKAFELCDGKEECQKEAQASIRYLLDVNRSLRLEPMAECELACPDRR